MKTYDAILATLLIAASCPLVSAQDQPTNTDLVDSLKETNALLKKQVATLESENARLTKELKELRIKLDKTGTSAAKSPAGAKEKTDPFVVGSSWTGNLDGRDARGNEFHNAATAVIVSREDNAFQIRTTIQDVEWVYDCVREKKVYRISKAVLTKAPANFSSKPGVIRIADSQITSALVKGKRVLKISVTRPIGDSGVNAVYTMALDE